MPMTKKHYAAVAEAIREERRSCTDMDLADHEFARIHLTKLTERLAYTFQQDNPRFDATAFLKAAGHPMEES